MTKFIAKGIVKYNGKNYTAGSVIEVKDEHVEEFKAYGWEIVGEEVKKDGEGEEGGQDLSKLTNAELKALLDEKEIKYPANANKADLLALLG